MTKQQVLVCLYSLIKDVEDPSINIRLVAVACLCSEKDIASVFKQMIKEGLIKKRFTFLPVYKITDKGWAEAKQAYENAEAKG